jgi:hypothetical protein
MVPGVKGFGLAELHPDIGAADLYSCTTFPRNVSSNRCARDEIRLFLLMKDKLELDSYSPL